MQFMQFKLEGLTSSRRINVGVEERGNELDLGRGGWEVVLEDDLTLVETSLPRGSLLSRDPVPVYEINSK